MEIMAKNLSGVCLFCNLKLKDELNVGKLYTYKNMTVHYFCMLFATGLPQRGKTDKCGIQGFLTTDIKNIVRRGVHVRCKYCNKRGATIRCNESFCKAKFHFPCGVYNGSMNQYFGEFLSYCNVHRIHQVVPFQKIVSPECPICLRPVENRVGISSIWPPCCHNSWIHRICLQMQALSFGYFFKCPLCNDKDRFVPAMKLIGIYVPEQDASWEMEENAFHELRFQYSQCDSEICLCPKGRTYNKLGSRWTLQICRSCGSKGCHLRCGAGPMYRNWSCSECLTVLRKDQIQNGNSSYAASASRNDVDEEEILNVTHSSSESESESVNERQEDKDATNLDSGSDLNSLMNQKQLDVNCYKPGLYYENLNSSNSCSKDNFQTTMSLRTFLHTNVTKYSHVILIQDDNDEE